MDLPSNSDKSKGEPLPPKKVERITEHEAIRRKKPLGKQFAATFIRGDMGSAARYVIFDVLVPAARDALADAGSQGIERLIFGESRSGRRRGPTAPPSAPSGYVSYNRYAMGQQQQPAQREISRTARAQHNFDDIILPSRAEADDVLERLYDLLNRYECATVGDLYELVGIKGNQLDQKWGWTSLRGSSVTRVRGGGFLLDLPEPESLT